MAKIKFYRQERYDGGIRAGISVNDTQVLHYFDAGSPDFDPSLLWYLNLVFEGRSLPDGAETARQWLVDHSAHIRDELQIAAKHLQLGVDTDELRPFEAKMSRTPPGVKGTILISGNRGLADGELAQRIKDTAQRLAPTLNSMEPLVRV